MAGNFASESSDFPILCDTCLGSDRYVRMTKEDLGNVCKICERPFSVFRWVPGKGMRQKKTEICQTCSKIKNVCQTCILDLDFNLPVQVRDSVLQVKDNLPVAEQNRRFFVANAAKTLGEDETLIDYSKSDRASQEKLKSMARFEPYYKRNRAHICTMFLKGKCTRGETCPYRHELPVAIQKGAEEVTGRQNIKDRFYGRNDSVAAKILSEAKTSAAVALNDNTGVTGLYISGMRDDAIDDNDLRDYFAKFGPIKKVVTVKKAGSGFVYFKKRSDAEAAFPASNEIHIKDQQLQVHWVKKKGAV